MSDMREAVSLPDPAVKRLLHPTDLPVARSLYVRGWWFGRFSSLPIVVALGAAIWWASGNVLASLAATISTFAIAWAASRWHTARAWDFIPRARQSTDGARSWRLLAAALDAAAVVLTVTVVLVSMGGREIPGGVVAWIVGAGVGVVLLQGLEVLLAGASGRRPYPRAERLLLLVAVAVSTVIVAAVGGAGVWSGDAVVPALAGAGSILLAYGIWWSVTVWQQRHDGTDAGNR